LSAEKLSFSLETEREKSKGQQKESRLYSFGGRERGGRAVREGREESTLPGRIYSAYP
jgi:hypothetical protein